MKNNLRVDPIMTYDHMDSDMQNTTSEHPKVNTQTLAIAAEIITLLALLGFMILLLN